MPAAPPIVSGQMLSDGTAEVLPGRHVRDVLDGIYQLQPHSTAFHRVLTDRLQVKKTFSTTVEHVEDQYIPDWDLANGAYTTETTITVDNGSYHQPGDILKNPATGETMRITGVATNDLTVIRSVGAVAIGNIADNQPLLRLGQSSTEGAGAPIAKHTQTAMPVNYTEIKRSVVELSRTANQVSLHGNKSGGRDERTRLRLKRGEEHGIHWENVLMHGEKSVDVTTGARRATAGGLDEWATENVLNLTGASGVLADKVLINFIGDVVQYGSGGTTDMNRVMFAGRPIINQMQMFGQGKLQTNPTKSGRYGFPVMTYYTYYGEIDVVHHPLLVQGYAGTAYVLAMGNIMIRPLQRTVLMLDRQNNDTDGFKDEYLTEQSYSFTNPEQFGVIKNAVETTS